MFVATARFHGQVNFILALRGSSKEGETFRTSIGYCLKTLLYVNKPVMSLARPLAKKVRLFHLYIKEAVSFSFHSTKVFVNCSVSTPSMIVHVFGRYPTAY